MTDFDEAFKAYVKEVELHEATWWKQDDAAQECCHLVAGLRDQLESTALGLGRVWTWDVYYNAGAWSCNRRQIHENIVDKLVPPPNSGTRVPPLAFFTLGMPASGKTSMLRHIVAKFCERQLGYTHATGSSDDMLIADADNVRESFDEYEGGLGSRVVQDELVVVTYPNPDAPPNGSLWDRVFQVTPHTRFLLIDEVGNSSELPDEVNLLASAGWAIYILVTELPTDEALRRAKYRALYSGRYVPLEYISSVGNRPVLALEAALKQSPVTGWSIFNTEVPQGTPPIIVRGDGKDSFGKIGEPTPYW